ncbi:hypothetical protein F4811DRAFT_549909 [Daldinia bambusicola]|nr:hypothetical protein F4811DRAFT_549909 [Daldinia bambusicola]
MKALAAAGLVGNVLQFVGTGCKILSASKDMYGAGSKSSQSAKDIEFIATEMKRLALSLVAESPTLRMKDDDETLRRLTAKCKIPLAVGIRRGGQYRFSILEKLQETLRLSDETLLASKRRLLLDALKHQGMEDRFYYVGPAHVKTFEWIIRDDPGHDSASAEDLDERKTIVRLDDQATNFRESTGEHFNNWLQRGNDIAIFVSDRLKNIPDFPTLVDYGDVTYIVKKVVNKVEGVFHWVRLVLTAVENGMLNGDDPSELLSRIDAFPNELTALYQNLFDSIPSADRPKAFETLRTMRTVRMAHDMGYRNELSLLRFLFLNKVINDQNYAMEMKTVDTSDYHITQILKIIRGQIYGRCKGLPESRCSASIYALFPLSSLV